MIRKIYLNVLLIGLVLFAGVNSVFAQDKEISSEDEKILKEDEREEKENVYDLPWYERMTFKAYGELAYHSYSGSYDYDKYRKAYSDTTRLSIEPKFLISPVWSVEAEIEWEHGGTGSTMEVDKLEEFGEYEVEIEAGGEAILEELYLEAEFAEWLELKVGRIHVPFGVLNMRDKPTQFFTVDRSETEVSLIPTVWYENGIGVSGEAGVLSWNAVVVNGLDSSGFSSAGWISTGYQTRFETVVHEDWAFAGRLDWNFLPSDKENIIGFSTYYGEADNRPKDDFEHTVLVRLVDVHAIARYAGFDLRSSVLYGDLTNSESLSLRNASLSNNLEVKRTPVGASALGYFIEFGYDVFDLWAPAHWGSLVVFGRYDSYDTQYTTEGDVFDNPRWDREVVTGGINYFPVKEIVFKAQYAVRKIEITPDDPENQMSLGVGFNWQ